MSKDGKVVAWYVNDGTTRHDFTTLKEARAFWDTHPEAQTLGEWIETCRSNERGVVRSRHGNVIEDRRPT